MKDMDYRQKKLIQDLFLKKRKTYHQIALEAGVRQAPDKFEDLDYETAKKIIRFHYR
jgi:hypothetical protein